MTDQDKQVFEKDTDNADDIEEKVAKDASQGTEENEADAIRGSEEKLAEAQQELKEEHDRFLRLYAEFENYKKRSAREMQDFRKFANESLIREILPVVDNLERAVLSSNENENADSCIVEGVEMTLRELVKIFERFHVIPVEALGKPFDPAFHEAMGQEESEEHGDNIVLREFQKGYLLHDRLIRPAMVIISKAKVRAEGDSDGQKAADDPKAEQTEQNK